jgi:hypothetical protein
MKFKIIVSFIIVLHFGSYSQNKVNDIPGLSTISQKDLMETVEFLASKDLAGRMSGSEGYNKAAKYTADQLKELNLKPMGDNGYFQNFKVEYNEIYSPVKLNLINGDTKTEYKLGKDFVFRGFTGSGNIKAPVVFCGYGITKPEFGYDDYANVDVKGKIVLAFKHNPSWKIGGKDWGGNYPRYKASVAAKHGAVGILFVSTQNEKIPQKIIMSILEGEGEQNENFPQAHVDIPVAEKFLADTENNLSALQTKIDSVKAPFSFELKTSAEVEVHTKYFKEHNTMNVVGVLEGSDPSLKSEYLVVGAHLDHVGSEAGQIFAPGANDNASGSAAVLEIAEAFVKGKVKPKRSIIFVLFASEEIGLHGSKFFVNHSPVPLKNIVAMVNLDCIGCGDSIQVGNGKSAPTLWNIAKSIDSLSTKMMVDVTWNGGGADASPFHEKGIPVAYFVTTNGYEHLHYMTDTPETLNKELFEKITKLAYMAAYEVAEGRYTKESVKEK